MTYLVTGAAGFVGYHVAERLLERGDSVVGIDSLTPYYDVRLKQSRLDRLSRSANFRFLQLDLADRDGMRALFGGDGFRRVIHLGAQAGVRYSLTHPHAYADSNLVGFLNVLEGCRSAAVEHLVFASSSSVYGANRTIPFSVADRVDHPVSLYAATKKANELMAHTYSHLYGLPTTGLRFFTVYGPWGRPDMAYFSFTRDILSGTPIDVYNHGRMRRDFTYIDDVVEGVIRVVDRPAQANGSWSGLRPDAGSSAAPYRIYNIGNNQPVELMEMISILQRHLGCQAELRMLPMQAGDVLETYADVSDLERDVGFRPCTPLDEGLEKFVRWYKEYYQVG